MGHDNLQTVSDMNHVLPSPRRTFLRQGAFAGASAVLGGMVPGITAHAAMGTSEMNIFDVIRNRRSVRDFKPTLIPDEHITMMLDAARFAPTSGNQQPWKFLVVKDRTKINELKEAVIQYWSNQAANSMSGADLEAQKARFREHYTKYTAAPLFIVVLTDSQSQYPDYNQHDGPLAAANLLLAARALKYGTVYATDSFPYEVTSKLFNIPARYRQVMATPVGVPVDWPVKEKKALDEFVVYDMFR